MKFWNSLDDVESKIKVDRVFEPVITEAAREAKMKRWSQAIERSIGFGKSAE